MGRNMAQSYEKALNRNCVNCLGHGKQKGNIMEIYFTKSVPENVKFKALWYHNKRERIKR